MSILTRIDCNFVPVVNIEESIEWYTSKIGFKLMWNHGDYAAMNVDNKTPEDGQANSTLGQAMMTLVKVNELQSMGFIYEDRKHPFINFYTKDIYTTHQALKDQNVEVSDINDFGTVKGFDFIDNNGHLMGVCSF